MIQHELIQGSDEWCQFRLNHFGASEAAAMLGISTRVKRNELLHMKATGTAKEFSDWVQKNILDYGHEVEALARPIQEKILGEDLYPVTCSDGKISASCDGLTISETRGWEHKQWNASLAAAVAAGELPDEYMAQPQQCMMVTGAECWTFTVSDGTEENRVSMEILPDPSWFERLRAGWRQFEIDKANYQYIEILPVAVAAPVKDLPALSIRVDGQLTLNHNLTLFGEKLQSFIADINVKPEDDQAFADAEQAIKVMERAETALGAAEASALGQISTVDEMVRTVATYKELARKTRLMLEKMVKARKETIRVEIQQAGFAKCAEHFASLNARLGKPYMPRVEADFAGVMKGKRTIASLRDAVDTELARFKIEANAIADRIQLNLTSLRELAKDHAFLFADTSAIVLKANDDLVALIKSRIADHVAAEAAKEEALRAQIAAEEKVKAEAAARAENARQQRIDSAILGIREGVTDAKFICKTADDIRKEIEYVEQRPVLVEVFQERMDEAVAVKTEVLELMRAELAARITAETEAQAIAARQQAVMEAAQVRREEDAAPAAQEQTRPTQLSSHRIVDARPAHGIDDLWRAAEKPSISRPVDNRPPITTGTLCALAGEGVSITAAFLQSLGIHPVERPKESKSGTYWAAGDVPLIFSTLAVHFAKLAKQDSALAA